jgi:hypothetical protein
MKLMYMLAGLDHENVNGTSLPSIGNPFHPRVTLIYNGTHYDLLINRKTHALQSRYEYLQKINGATCKNLSKSPDGTQRSDLVTYPSGTTFPNGTTCKNLSQSPDGTQRSDFLTLANGTTFKNWSESSDGTQRSDLLTYPSGETRKNWSRSSF